MKIRWIGAALVAVSLLVAGCGSDDKASGPTTPAGPRRIISLSPTHTEILFAIGAGDQVIAVDDYSNFPAEALEKPHDLSGFEPNLEAIAALKPDLVVIGDDFNGLTEQLATVNIEVWSGPSATTFDDVYSQIEQLGATTGHAAEAAELVGDMKTDIAAAVAAAPKQARPLTYYHELDDQYFSVTSDSFIGQVYGLFGLVNIADGADPGNSYPQLSAEYIVDKNPDLVFLADSKCCNQTAATVAARDGWAEIAAVKHGGVVVMDDDIASRWGPRIVDYITAVSAALSALPATVG